MPSPDQASTGDMARRDIARRALPAWLQATILTGVICIAYWRVVDAGFLWDDIQVYIVENELLRNLDGLRAIWTSRQFMDFYPLTLTLFWIEWQAWGAQPLGYHLVNVLLHGGATLLLWRLLRHWRIPGAWLAALLFGVHPVNVESVAWISQHKNTLSAVFFFAALRLHTRSVELATGRRLVAATFLFALALLSKPAVIAYPLVLLAWVWWRRRRIERRDLHRLVPALVLAGIVAGVTLVFQGTITEDGHVYEGTFLSRFAVAGRAVWFYVFKALFPSPLVLVYPRWSVVDPGTAAYLPALLVLAVTASLWALRHRWPGVLFAWLVYLMLLLPVLGFVDIGYMQFSFVADHWQYLALAAFLATLVALLDHLRHRMQLSLLATRLLAASVVVLCTVMTQNQTRIYVDEETAWRTTLRHNPTAWNAHARLGGALRERGALQESVVHYLEAVRLHPSYAAGHQVLGTLYAQLGSVREAERHFETAIRLQPGSAEAHANFGHFLAMRNEPERALRHLQRARALQPDNASTLADLGFAQWKNGDAAAAVQTLTRSLALRNDPDVAFNLGVVARESSQPERAVAAFSEVVRQRPSDGQAWLLLAEESTKLGEKEKAREALEAALRVARSRGDEGLRRRAQSALDALP